MNILIPIKSNTSKNYHNQFIIRYESNISACKLILKIILFHMELSYLLLTF